MGKKICEFSVDDRIFCQEAILKAAYLYSDQFFVKFSYEDSHCIKVQVEAKQGEIPQNFDKEFCNQLLAQMLRYRISLEQKNTRELILGRALYSSCITSDSVVFNEDEDLTSGYNLDDIAVNWFDVYEE